jgi:sugar phosphate isomerase/epimerase
MISKISLAHLTAIDLSPPKLIEAAAQAGFDAVGLRLIQVTATTPDYPLMQDAKMMLETKAALRDTGLCVNDIEFVKIEPDTDISTLMTFLDAGADLGACEVICAPYDQDLDRLADTLGRFTEAASDRGLGVSLEFFPWTSVPDLKTAYRVACAAGPDVGILVDALHFNRSASTLDDVRCVPQNRLRLAHLCDAVVRDQYSTQDLLFTAREERLPPGQGEIDLLGLIAALPPDISYGLEVPMAAYTQQQGDAATLGQVMSAFQELQSKL